MHRAIRQSTLQRSIFMYVCECASGTSQKQVEQVVTDFGGMRLCGFSG